VIRNEDLDEIGLFAEPQRRRVYEQLQIDGEATVTDLVAALGMGRTLVAFHLGKLIEGGFVEALAPEPVAGTLGRPAHRYRPTRREVVATVPDRSYDLFAAVLLDGLADQGADRGAVQGSGRSWWAGVLSAARRRGADLAHRWAIGTGPRPPAAPLSRLERLLTALGYVPVTDGAELMLRNCPFEKFRATNTEQICPLNQALGDGYLEGLGLTEQVRAGLRPHSDMCCVVFSDKAA
jgi:predicted ArsR family transcriptional regulator